MKTHCKTKADRAILEALHKRRAATITDAEAISCEFHGKIFGDDGKVVLGAFVAVSKDSRQSGALDPSAIHPEADGSWRFGPVPRGTYLVSVTAPGHLPQTRMERCDGLSPQVHEN